MTTQNVRLRVIQTPSLKLKVTSPALQLRVSPRIVAANLLGAHGISVTYSSSSGGYTISTTNGGNVVTTSSTNVITNAMTAQMAATTIKGNAAAVAGDPNDIQISTLTDIGTPSATLDWLLIEDHTTGTLKKVNSSVMGGSSASSNPPTL